ncbi:MULTISPECIES: response regulator transcription factor [Nostocales]|uniref:Chemotaxis protein CheY n=3 Tax=Nostocales TaxID=1161 RepID=A0A0C1RDF3_9CYAN|nr:response regulator [Tolypothrix bouteillei]KAF3886212.1 response regulator transcription factor [Tolypothrix bouteillei VB521301]
MTKVLVIEDEVESRNIFLECLEAEGFDTISAENGLIGVQKAQENLPDLIICDVSMPELDGYGVLTSLRQNTGTARIPFIFLSAKSTKAEVRQGMTLGADDYLTKPTTAEELLEAIATRLKKQATIKEWYETQSPQVTPPPANTAPSADSQSSSPASPQLKEVFDFIEANYHQAISLSDVAQAVGYSPAYLTDLMRRQTGKTVHQWIVEHRMTKACSLLLETKQSVEQIAEAVGYQYVGCFFRQFRISFGTTPQVWRNQKIRKD